MERKGICKNVGVCSKANKVQVITDDDAEFVCPECGEPLEPIKEELGRDKLDDKKRKQKSMFVILSVLIIAILGGVVFFVINSGNDSFEDEIPTAKQEIIPEQELPSIAEEPVVETSVVEEHVVEAAAQEETTPAPVEESKPAATTAPVQTSSRNKDLGYASWKGALKNGQPNDENGTMTFKESHRIDSRDPQARVAEPGDYIIGEYVDGKLVQGVWYDKTNTVKGSIIIGR